LDKTRKDKPSGKHTVESPVESKSSGESFQSPMLKVANDPWYAVYTRSRWEKRLMELLTAKGIEAYVPLRKVIHKWSDRNKLVDEPLIRSYCFVKVGEKDYYEVLNTPGAVRYIWFSGKPAAIPEQQINTLRAVTGAEVEVDCVADTFQPGVHVMVNAGPLTGITGELVSISNKKKVIIRIDHLNQVITLSISPLLLERVHEEFQKKVDALKK
jgi:transcriptional antiterminator RfaH